MGNGWITPLLIIGGLAIAVWIFLPNIMQFAGGMIANSPQMHDAMARLSTPQAKARGDQINADLKAGRITQDQARQDVFKMASGSNYAYYY